MVKEKPAKAAWVCPKCGRQFAGTNQPHVCEIWTLQDHLGGKPELARNLFERFIRLAQACGELDYSITRANIGLRGQRRIFAGVMPTQKGLNGYLDLPHAVDDPRFHNVSPYTKRLFVHHFRLTSEEQLDEDFAGWICESYAVGQGEHLKS